MERDQIIAASGPAAQPEGNADSRQAHHDPEPFDLWKAVSDFHRDAPKTYGSHQPITPLLSERIAGLADGTFSLNGHFDDHGLRILDDWLCTQIAAQRHTVTISTPANRWHRLLWWLSHRHGLGWIKPKMITHTIPNTRMDIPPWSLFESGTRRAEDLRQSADKRP